MRAGTLTEKVTILRAITTVNSVGEEDKKYNILCNTRCKADNSSGNKSIENNEIVFNYIKTFYFRYYVDVQETDIIIYQDKKYRILTIEKNKAFQEIKAQAELINE